VVEENTMVTSDPISESAPTIVEEPDNTQTEPDPVVSTTDSISTVVTYQSGAVVVNEIMSNPAEGENEWIKLFNPGETTIDLTGWFVTDATDKKTVLEGQIETHGYFIIDSPKGKLNNDGDEVNLFAADGTLIDQLIYGTAEIKAPKKDEPLNRADIQKSVTEESYDAPSPTLPTITAESTPVPVDQSKPTEDVVDLPAPTPAVHRIIAVAAPEISSVAKKTTSAKTNTTRKASTNALARTKISGVVTALPGTFGEQIMFIDGIQVYANNKDWPTLQLGDVVAVSGTRSSNRGEQRIKIKTAADIYITSSQVLTPVEVESSQLESLPEGRLVMISGRVVYRDGDRLTVEDKTGVMTAVAYAKTDVSWTDLSSTQVRITGVLRHIDGQNLIYPRTSDDVEFIDDAPTVAPMASGTIDESSNFDWLGYGAYALLGGALAILAFWFLRSLKNPKLTNE
jgi:predicted extracellular nuclease